MIEVDYDRVFGVATITGDVEWCRGKHRGNNNNPEYENRINDTDRVFIVGVAGRIIVFCK